MNYLIVFIILFLIVIFDFIWIKFLAGDFFTSQLKEIGRISNGKFNVIVWSAFLVWFVMALGIYFFVIKNYSNYTDILVFGAFFGFCLYVVFDFTNYAILKNYPLKFIFVDVLWGTFLCGSVSVISFYILKNLF